MAGNCEGAGHICGFKSALQGPRSLSGPCRLAAAVARVAPLGSEISRLQPRRGQKRPLARIASSVGCSAATPPKSRAILEPSQGFVRASWVHWCSGAAFRASLRPAKRSKSLVASVRSDIFSSPAGAPSCARRVVDEWSEKDRENTPSGPSGAWAAKKVVPRIVAGG